MVALTALCAALFAAVLLPFKLFPIIPGITEIRPANALPVVFSLLFGPAAAWGAAFGNTIGAFGGTLGIGTLFGFMGNLAYGYIPYRLWRVLGGTSTTPDQFRFTGWVRFLIIVFTSSLGCAVFIAWPVDATGLAPFQIVAPLIFLNNFLMAALLAPPLLLWIAPRAEKLGLLYRDVMDLEDLRPAIAGRLGFALLFTNLVAALLMGLIFRYQFAPEWAQSPSLATAPFLILALIGLLLI